MAELTEPEYWILESLDDAALLPAVLSGIEEGVRRVPRRWPLRPRWVMRPIRPSLEIEEAARAIRALAEKGHIEVCEWRQAEWPPTGAHPYDLGRPLGLDELAAVLDDRRNWVYPADAPDREFEYWIGETETGLAAFRRYVEAR